MPTFNLFLITLLSIFLFFIYFILPKNNRHAFSDPASLCFLFLFVALFAYSFVDFSITPFEDAAGLMRYAQHFAQGHGIVWNIGEKPVDGATDFLYMIVLGLFVKAGISLELATRSISFMAHLLTVWLVYLASRRLFGAYLLPAIISALYLAVGPGLYYTAVYFGTPFFALFASFTWYIALVIILNGENMRRSCLFAASALIVSLIRPEGVILSGLILLSILYIKGFRGARSTVLCYLGAFLFLGGFYFLWRWRYFGFPLPNPFYKKGGGHIYSDSFRESIRNTVGLSLPFLPAFISGLYFTKTIRLAIGFLLPVIGFSSAFILITNEMNFAARFQYALLPIILMSWWPLVLPMKKYWHVTRWNGLKPGKKAALILLIMVVCVGTVDYQYARCHRKYNRDSKYDIAVMLAEYKDRHFSIATSETGILALYSGWRTLDTWGLNDQWIAHHGKITEEYLGLFEPHLIMFHEYSFPLDSSDYPLMKGFRKNWFEMALVLKTYAEKNNYVLAAAFGDTPYDIDYYYVRPDFPEASGIIKRIRFAEYRSLLTGKKAINYALSPR